MALENISNVPQVCSESLLEHFIFNIFLGEAPQTPLRTFPWDACGVSVAMCLCPTGPPLEKNPGSAPGCYPPIYCLFKIVKWMLSPPFIVYLRTDLDCYMDVIPPLLPIEDCYMDVIPPLLSI